MIRTSLLIAGLAMLAACDKEPEVHATNASIEEVAEQVRAASGDEAFVRAGKWRSNVTIEQMEMPGLPPEIRERMKAALAQTQARGFETCLTEEQAKRPKEDFFAGKNANCRYDHFNMDDGKIDAKMRCSGEGGVSKTMEMTGSYSPESYQMIMSSKMESGPEPTQGMAMRMRVEAKRTGACEAGDKG